MLPTPKQVKVLLLPQELETFYILPTLRHALAIELHRLGKKQNQIAEIFGVTSSTISQYKSKKRGSQITFVTEILSEISKSAGKITDRYTYIREIQHLLRILRNTNILCQIHHKLNKLPTNCYPKNIGCGSHTSNNQRNPMIRIKP